MTCKCHVLFDRLALVLDPLDRDFEVLVAVRPPFHIPAADCISRAGGPLPAEIPLCVGHPRASIDRVPQLLGGQLLARDVDDPKPRELLARRPLADIDLQRVAENLFLLVVLQVVEIPPINTPSTTL